MALFSIIALLVFVSTVYSYLNARFFKLPGTIGIVSIAIVVSVITILIDKVSPGAARYLTLLSRNINFSETVLNVMLGFLLFAGSFNSSTKKLRKEMRPVIVLSTVGVILSAGIFALLFYYSARLFHIDIPFLYCLLFGALISPTDPVAVGAIIKESNLPANLSTIISGESLFNDGVGLVLFITVLEIIESGTNHIDLIKTAVLFVREVIGGIGIGLIFGFIAYRLMKTVEDFQTIVLVSITLVMSISVVCAYFHCSIPLAVVAAGLLTGNVTINASDNEKSHETLKKLWQLIDEMLNTILFVMIGLQMINLPYLDSYWVIGVAAIVLILVARWGSIITPLIFLRHSLRINFGSVNILTWAGVRGAISIALALSLPYSHYRHIILAGSYFIVIFSIIFQGLTLNKLIDRVVKRGELGQ